MKPFTEIRLRLRANGYQPIPVSAPDCTRAGPAAGKAPIIVGWQKFGTADEREIERWERDYSDHTNTGILAATTPGFDIDIMNAAVVDHMVHFVRGWVKDGTLLRRVGRPPKVLIPFRADKPFKKIIRLLTGPNGENGKLEILGDGQQYVVHGIHPETKQPYEWLDGLDLCDVPRQQLEGTP